VGWQIGFFWHGVGLIQNFCLQLNITLKLFRFKAILKAIFLFAYVYVSFTFGFKFGLVFAIYGHLLGLLGLLGGFFGVYVYFNIVLTGNVWSLVFMIWSIYVATSNEIFGYYRNKS